MQLQLKTIKDEIFGTHKPVKTDTISSRHYPPLYFEHNVRVICSFS